MQTREDVAHDRRRLPPVLLALALSGLTSCGTRTDISSPGGASLSTSAKADRAAKAGATMTTTITMMTTEDFG